MTGSDPDARAQVRTAVEETNRLTDQIEALLRPLCEHVSYLSKFLDDDDRKGTHD